MRREVTGCLLVIFWLILLLFGTAGQFWLVTMVVAGFAANEYLTMQYPDGLSKAERTALVGFIILPVFFQIPGAEAIPLSAHLFAAFFFYCLYRFLCHKEAPVDLANFGKVALGMLYVGFLFAHLPMIRSLPDGAAWILILTAITAGSDIGAYYIGRCCGKNKLCPDVSPQKTKEGMWGGLATAIVLSIIVALSMRVPLGIASLVLLTIILSFVGIFGDLIESAMKRSAGVKDSGAVLPGHGGALDRLDSMMFAGPALYYFLIWTLYL
jgi:phosphatidate cytidylyltransferase